jgi:tRNA(Ile)-lysidine synthase
MGRLSQLVEQAIAVVPPGRWAVGVSGGADSVALLLLLVRRADLTLHVVHLNHQTRGSESDGDAGFVAELASELGLACTVENRSAIEDSMGDLPRNPSARYRRARMALFGRVIAEHDCQGVILAHHADDQAETILQRLVRGSGYAGLAGMSGDARVGEVRCVRPLLATGREALRRWLEGTGQSWREDSSNRSDRYLRNRLRVILKDDAKLRDALLRLGEACGELRGWTAANSPVVSGPLHVDLMRRLPGILGAEVARRWLLAQGVQAGEIEPGVIERLVAMCVDASTPARAQFPGGILVGRKKGVVTRVAG